MFGRNQNAAQLAASPTLPKEEAESKVFTQLDIVHDEIGLRVEK